MTEKLLYYIDGDHLHRFGFYLQKVLATRPDFEAVPESEARKQQKKLAWSDKNRYSPIQNYLDGTETISSKCNLAKLTQHSDFVPKTYLIYTYRKPTLPRVLHAGPPALWFLKPCGDLICGGQGISVGPDPSTLVRNALEKPHEKVDTYVLQSHVPYPVLYTKDGKDYKFDVRLHVMVLYRTVAAEKKQTPSQNIQTKVNVYLQRLGYLRLAAKPWQPEQPTIYNQLTNSSVSVTHKDFDEYHCAVLFNEDLPYYLDIFTQAKDITKQLFSEIAPQLDTTGKDGAVLLGLDVMVTEPPSRPDINTSKFKAYLLEVNHRVCVDYYTEDSDLAKARSAPVKTFPDFVIKPFAEGRFPTIEEADSLGWEFVWSGAPGSTHGGKKWQGYHGPTALAYNKP